MTARLVEPDVRFERTVREAMEEFAAEGRGEELGSLAEQPSFAAFVHELAEWSQGRSLPDGWVPGSTYWLIDDDEFVAKVEIRHRLTEALQLRGGHVGYAVRPTGR